jgi:hypothetical protein
MLIIHNKILPFPGYRAINLFGIIFVRGDEPLSARTITHETIHTKQMLETLVIGFYIWYLLEFLIKLVVCLNWDRAYSSVSFEQEAFTYDRYPNWPEWRWHWTWWAYVFKLTNK